MVMTACNLYRGVFNTNCHYGRFWPEAFTAVRMNVGFSNRPFGVKLLQTIHHYSVDVARGLALLFGIGTTALVWGFRCQGVRRGGEAFLCRSLGSLQARFSVPICAP
jgi:hypothetical protein